MPMPAALATLLVLASTLPAAAAGLVLTADEKGSGGGGTLTIQSDGERLRMDMPHGIMIWRGDRHVLWRVDAQERSYTEITREGMQAMRGAMDAHMNEAMAQMRQQMANMPEAQRKQIEQMMAARGAPMPGGAATAAAHQVSYRKIGGARKVGAWPCEDWEKLVDGERREELCLAPLAELGLKREELKPMRDMAAFARELAGPMARNVGVGEIDPDALAKAAGKDVYPVRVVASANGGHEFVLKSVEHRSVPPATFEIPAGYAKHDMATMGGGRGR